MVRKGRGFGEITTTTIYRSKKMEGLASFYSPGKIIEYDVLAYLSDSTAYIKEYPLPSGVYQKSSFYHNAVKTKSGKYFLIESFDENRLVTVNGKTCNVYKTYPNISGEGTEKDAAIFRYASKMAIKGDYSRIAFGTYIGGVLDILQIDDTLGIFPCKDTRYLQTDIRQSKK